MFTPSFMITTTSGTVWLDRVEELFMRFGIKSITMDDVASDLGISKKTLYQMVESKDDLVAKVVTHHISKSKTQCLAIASKAASAIDEIFIVLDTNSQDIASVKANIVHDLQKYHHDVLKIIRKFQYDFVLKTIKDNILRGRREGLYREDFDIEILARLHLGTSFTFFDPLLFPAGQYPKEKIFREYILHFLHSIVSAKGHIYLKTKIT